MYYNCVTIGVSKGNYQLIFSIMSTELFNINSFIRDSVATISKPKEYFASLKIEGGLGEPIIKAVIYGAIAGIFNLLWSIMKIGAVTGEIYGSSIGIMSFFWAIIVAVLALFIGSLITLIVSAICGGSTNYEENARVTASLLVLMPVNAFFGFLSGINFYFGFILSMIVSLYGLYMLYNALTGSLKSKGRPSMILTIVLGAIVVLIMIVSVGTRHAANRFLDEFEFDNEKIEQGLDEMNRDMEEALEELQEPADTI